MAKLIDDDLVLQIEEEQDEKGADRLLFSLLTLISKLNKHCGLLELSKPHDTLYHIWGKETSVTCAHALMWARMFHVALVPAAHIEAHLRYPHCWVWLTASQLFGQLFAAHQPERLVAVWRGEGADSSSQSSATTFICTSLDKKVKLGSPLRLVCCCNLSHF